MKRRSALVHAPRSQSSSSGESMVAAKPLSHVTFQGRQQQQEEKEATPRRSLAAAASSEEDSVAEMDYMSEGSLASASSKKNRRAIPAASDHQETEAPDDDKDGPRKEAPFLQNILPLKRTTTPPPGTESQFHVPLVPSGGGSATATGETSSSCAPTGSSTTPIRTSTPQQKEPKQNDPPPPPNETPQKTDPQPQQKEELDPPSQSHSPSTLPQFRQPHTCVWTASHAANLPTEDRSAYLVNVLLQPLPPNFDSETQLPPLEPDYKALIRMNLWCVVDGHGGGCVATYASEVLLPHIAASVSRALGCAIVDRGSCVVNGELRDANALDLDGLITTSDRSMCNPNSIHYRAPYEEPRLSEEETNDNVFEDHVTSATNHTTTNGNAAPATSVRNKSSSHYAQDEEETTTPAPSDQSHRRKPHFAQDEEERITPLPSDRRNRRSTPPSANSTTAENDVDEHLPHDVTTTTNSTTTPSSASSQHQQHPTTHHHNNHDDHENHHHYHHDDHASVSSVKTSLKTAASPANRDALIGTHSPQEVAAITGAITESFLAVDEGWINSIDPVATHQNSCQSNGRWNSGACALAVFTIQRLDWTSVSEPDREKELKGTDGKNRRASQNRDAARRRMLDNAARIKSANSSMSTVSSTSSLTTEEYANDASGLESEITETEGEDEQSLENVEDRRRHLARNKFHNETPNPMESIISAPGGCSCHRYRPHDAILYTAHVGDCRAVMLGSAPPRTIKVRDSRGLPDTTDDESSHHSSDETECLSSSDHDADSSEEEDVPPAITEGSTTSTATSSYTKIPRRVVRQKSPRRRMDDSAGPFIALPPLQTPEVAVQFESELLRKERLNRAANSNKKESSDSSSDSQDSDDSSASLHLIHLPPVTRPIDLTTDHSAYNPAEVSAVLRRCNNAPRAISAGVGGGIKRVAGSLAVTRALGDAYLKTPKLSFLPYKSHAPYITARPEVNCRPLHKDGDKVLILATDGVWERAGGEDCLRWVRNFFEERVAEAERRSNRLTNQTERVLTSEEKETADKNAAQNAQDGAERDLFEKNELLPLKRKRDTDRSPTPTAKRRKRGRPFRMNYNVADVIVRRVLNKVRRARNISSLQALMSLPQGRARRSKHDDITASVVDLSAFVS